MSKFPKVELCSEISCQSVGKGKKISTSDANIKGGKQGFLGKRAVLLLLSSRRSATKSCGFPDRHPQGGVLLPIGSTQLFDFSTALLC